MERAEWLVQTGHGRLKIFTILFTSSNHQFPRALMYVQPGVSLVTSDEAAIPVESYQDSVIFYRHFFWLVPSTPLFDF